MSLRVSIVSTTIRSKTKRFWIEMNENENKTKRKNTDKREHENARVRANVSKKSKNQLLLFFAHFLCDDNWKKNNNSNKQRENKKYIETIVFECQMDYIIFWLTWKSKPLLLPDQWLFHSHVFFFLSFHFEIFNCTSLVRRRLPFLHSSCIYRLAFCIVPLSTAAFLSASSCQSVVSISFSSLFFGSCSILIPLNVNHLISRGVYLSGEQTESIINW